MVCDKRFIRAVLSLLIILLASVLLAASISGFLVHPVYESFSAPEQLLFHDRTVMVTDDAVYKTGWYSINGSAWQSFSLSGAAYGTSQLWLSGASMKVLPFFGPGEHYIITYTCSYNQSWDCHGGQWQLYVMNNSIMCNGTICQGGEYCSQDVCLLEVSGTTYFIGVDGTDANPGNFTHPWGTWQKAFDTAVAGDVVYFRGGVWYPTTSVVYSGRESGHNGTESDHIIYMNYPGEIPVLDLHEYNYTHDMAGLGIHFVTNVELRGLTIRNNKQDFFGQWISGLEFYQCGNLWVDRITSHGHGGYGIWFVGYDHLYLTNSDSYDNIDYLADDPGNRADGFQISSGGEEGDYLFMSGCRSWNNSDDGIEISHGREMEVFDSWSFNNGRLEFGAGQGFKYAGAAESDPSKRRTHHTISAGNKGLGYADQNLVIGPVGELANNLAYGCRWGFGSSPGSFNCSTGYANVSFKNNIVYRSTYGVVNGSYPSYYDQAYLAACWYGYPVYASYANNTWIRKDASPYWQYNPGVNVTANDFVSLDVSQLSAPRKPDGSLPDITFGHLRNDSDLIDAGVDVGLPYTGSAPDLGPFEYAGG